MNEASRIVELEKALRLLRDKQLDDTTAVAFINRVLGTPDENDDWIDTALIEAWRNA